MIQWLKKLFWKRCFYCKQKKQWFWYLWETNRYVNDKEYTEEELEICIDCASIPHIKEQPLVDEEIVEEEIVEEEKIESEPEPERECYSRGDMFLFSGYLMGAKENEPGINVTEVFNEWKERFKNERGN